MSECKYVGRCNSSRCDACNPTAAPELPDGEPTEQWAVECCHVIGDGAHYLEPRVLQRLVRTQLAMQGLRIIDAKDARVLEAVGAIPPVELNSSGNWYGWAKPIGDAERARRGSGT